MPISDDNVTGLRVKSENGSPLNVVATIPSDRGSIALLDDGNGNVGFEPVGNLRDSYDIVEEDPNADSVPAENPDTQNPTHPDPTHAPGSGV